MGLQMHPADTIAFYCHITKKYENILKIMYACSENELNVQRLKPEYSENMQKVVDKLAHATLCVCVCVCAFLIIIQCCSLVCIQQNNNTMYETQAVQIIPSSQTNNFLPF